MKRWLFLIHFLLLSGQAFAQIPSLSEALPAKESDLSDKEKKAMDLANKWKNQPVYAKYGKDGSVVYVYNSTLPSIICAPLFVCSIYLQEGEIIEQMDIGDPIRWKVTSSRFGNDPYKTPVVIIKPTEIGLETSLNISTNKRNYTLRLLSRHKDWMAKTAFVFPEDEKKKRQEQIAHLKQMKDADFGSYQNGTPLDYNYRLRVSSRKIPWIPQNVFNDGKKNYIQFPDKISFSEAPVVVLLEGRGANVKKLKKELVNYRKDGNLFIIDKVVTRGALLNGINEYAQTVEFYYSEK